MQADDHETVTLIAVCSDGLKGFAFLITDYFLSRCRVDQTQGGVTELRTALNDVFSLLQGPVTHVRTVSIGEKRQPAANTHTTVNKTHALITPPAKSIPGTRYAGAVLCVLLCHVLISMTQIHGTLSFIFGVFII